jgi:hypothetical protein
MTRVARVERLLRIVCGIEEFPTFVSDLATIYDVCSLSEIDITQRLADAYGRAVNARDLTQPIWKLVDWLDRQQFS